MTVLFESLRRLADVRVSNVDKKSVEGHEPVRLCNYTDVYYNDVITNDMTFMEATASRQQIENFRLQPGDTVITKDSETADDIGVPAYVGSSAGDLVCGYHLAMLRPGERLHPKFLFWVMASSYGREALSVNASGVTRYGLTYGAIKDVAIPVPPIEEQRRIADFLDEQVARIDEAISAIVVERELQSEVPGAVFTDLLSEWIPGFADHLGLETGALSNGWRVDKLGHVLRQFTNGYVGPTRDILIDDGIPYIQSLHIKKGVIDFERRPYFVSEEWHNERPRIHLGVGDVLIVQTGDIGSIAVVPEGFMDASCHALLIARPRQDLVSSGYLGEYLRSPLGRAQLLSRATGALHPHLESGIKESPVVIPPQAEQMRIVHEMTSVRESMANIDSWLSGQEQLLQERKRSLITSAVTGALDVTTTSALTGPWVSSTATAPQLVSFPQAVGVAL